MRETGTSIPDTAVLVPLAETLGVSVAELLACERMAQGETLDTGAVESLVQTAISYSEEAPVRAYRQKSGWTMRYLLALALGALGLFLNRGHISELTLTAVILGAVFGGYFCLFARTRLPGYYDQNKVNGIIDGPFRMNMPGLYFNNANWPHILCVGRIWACAVTAFYPLLALMLRLCVRRLWESGEVYFFLPLFGSLIIPLYIVGKKYE